MHYAGKTWSNQKEDIHKKSIVSNFNFMKSGVVSIIPANEDEDVAASDFRDYFLHPEVCGVKLYNKGML